MAVVFFARPECNEEFVQTTSNLGSLNYFGCSFQKCDQKFDSLTKRHSYDTSYLKRCVVTSKERQTEIGKNGQKLRKKEKEKKRKNKKDEKEGRSTSRKKKISYRY